MSRPFRFTAIILAFGATACAEALADPSGPEAQAIYSSFVQSAVSTAQIVVQGGGTNVSLNQNCLEGTRAISGTVTPGATTSAATLDIVHTINGCVSVPPGSDAGGRFVLNGSVHIGGTIGSPVVSQAISWSNSVTGRSGTCTPTSPTECR